MKYVFPLEAYLHIFQLEGYDPARLFKWWLSNILTRKTGSKKPFVWTAKAKLLYLLSIVLTLFLVTMAYTLVGSFLIFIIVACLLVFFPILQLPLSLFVIKPYEVWNKQQTIKKTREKILSLKRLKVIGITGSYGKTSVKEFLYQMLRTKYKVLRTPKSYNTIFGIAKVVDFELDSSYDYFICEMGGYKRGEIAELCKMVAPKYGILTGIAEQHLDRFGSLENIILGKFELAQSLPKDGLIVLNTDNRYIRDKLSDIKVPFLAYGLEGVTTGIKAENIKVSASGTSFRSSSAGRSARIVTKLLGKSSLQNVLGAATLAYRLGVPLSQITEVVKELSPVPHRLQLIKKDNYVVIDDSYNSNPEGFREAIEAVSLFSTKSKILVTPGIVDLGGQNETIHNKLGKLAAEVFSNVILVGRSERTKALQKGLEDAGFPLRSIVMANDLEAARNTLSKIVEKDVVVLFENDLPDNY